MPRHILPALLALTAGALNVWSYHTAEAAVVAPMQYSQIAWAALYGWALFGEVPDRATLLATAALALHEIESIARGIRADGAGSAARSPSTLDTTLEFDVASGSIEARRWSRHRECTC